MITKIGTMKACDIIRQKIANGEFEVPESIAKKVTKAIAIDDVLAVIYSNSSDSRRRGIIGLIDSDCVDMINSFSITYKNNDKKRYRQNIIDNEVRSSIALAVAVMCYKDGYFQAEEQNVHHIFDVCDNRYTSLKGVEPYSEHPAKSHNSDEYMTSVFKENGYSLEDVFEIIDEKLKSLS